MATLTVTTTTDYSSANLSDIALILFNTTGFTRADFAASQFPSQISNFVTLQGDAQQNAVTVVMASAGSFSAADWSFIDWTGGDSITVLGSSGADTIVGSSRDDAILGNGGADSLSGGDGNDLFRFYDGGIASGESIDGGAGTGDQLIVQGTETANFRLVAISNVEAIAFSSLVGSKTAEFLGSQVGLGKINSFYGSGVGDIETVRVFGSAIDLSSAYFAIWNSDDVMSLEGTGASCTIVGSQVSDQIAGTAGSDVLSGLGGNDSIIGGGGADQLDGGLGDDWLYVDSADTLIQGSLGFDRMIVQGSGAVVINLAAAGIEAAYGSTGGDTLNGASTSVALFLDGGAGNDQLTGGSAVDVLVGGAGADALNGGGGDDWLYTDAADTSIIGGTGFDRVFLTDTAGQAITLVGSGVELVWGNTGNDYIDLTNNGIVIGGPSYIIGDFGNDVIYGSQGIDVVISGFGVDAVFGNGGDDWLYVEAEDSLIVGGDGFDRGFVSGLTGVSNWDLSGSGLEVFFASDGGNDIVHNIGASVGMYILGQAGNDVISGGAGDDFFYGGLGADTIRGGAGNDNLWGGNEGASTPGDAGDRFEFVGNWGADRVWDWQDGSDVLAFSLAGVTNANQLGYAYDALNNVSTFWYGANVLTVNGLADRADVVIF